MAYQALYRTYRPRKFSDVVGQEHVTRTLMNSIRQGKTGHAYLFSGPRGTGKTTIARILARAINCGTTKDGEPCNECPRCRGSDEGLGVLEIDAASHGSVDDMRQLVAQVSQVPMSGGKMVYIIDEVHMLSKEAFNAFLKTLEEPPPHAVFVLATTEPGKLLPTIHSRCQHFAFRRLPIELVAEHISQICKIEKVPAEDGAVRLIARAGDGSVRDSMSVLEQAIAYQPNGLTLRGVREVLGIPDRMDIRNLGGHIIAADPGKVSQAYGQIIESGREPSAVLLELMGHFRDLLFASLDLRHSDLDLLPDEERDAVYAQASGLDVDRIHKAIAALAKSEGEIKWEDEAALLLEVSLLRLATKFGKISKVEKYTETEDKPVAVQDLPKEVASMSHARDTESTSPEPGGQSMKSLRTRLEDRLPVEPEPPQPIPVTTIPDSAMLHIPDDIDPDWKTILDKVHQASTADYILIAESTPSPSPQKWPNPGGDSTVTLRLALKYPHERGFLVKLINQEPVIKRLTARLEEAIGQPLMLRVGQTRSDDTDDDSGRKNIQAGGQHDMYDDEGSVSVSSGEPSLFPGAARPVPADPDLKKIHNLIVEDFPGYRVEQGE